MSLIVQVCSKYLNILKEMTKTFTVYLQIPRIKIRINKEKFSLLRTEMFLSSSFDFQNWFVTCQIHF